MEMTRVSKSMWVFDLHVLEQRCNALGLYNNNHLPTDRVCPIELWMGNKENSLSNHSDTQIHAHTRSSARSVIVIINSH